MNKNRIRGVGNQGERANDREALVTKGTLRRFGGRAGKVDVLTWGDLALGLKGPRDARVAEREVSRGRSRHRREATPKGRTMGRV
jgi:hypothetical protein